MGNYLQGNRSLYSVPVPVWRSQGARWKPALHMRQLKEKVFVGEDVGAGLVPARIGRKANYMILR
jgi:hypothetical protein